MPGCMRYVQPEVAKSFKPCNVYKRPCAPIDDSTIYKTSYFPLCPAERVKPVPPVANLSTDISCKMDTATVHQLSYPGHACGDRSPIIPPCDHSMLGSGPMQDMTTNRHDYVAKTVLRPAVIHPVNQIMVPCAPMQKDTVHQLSFPDPGGMDRVKSCRPDVSYRRPEVPMHSDTTQKLSYQPVCPSVPDPKPWVPSNVYNQPCVPMVADTTYALSFMGGRGERGQPIRVAPATELISNRCLPFDDRTIYKESFFGASGTLRPDAIRPAGQLDACDPKVRMDTETMYNLAYMGHFGVKKEPCVRPFEQIKNCRTEMKCPLQDLSTQRHDFVWKGGCRREPIRPFTHSMRPSAHMDTQTTAQMSYMPNPGHLPAISVQPKVQYQRPCVAMDTQTTQQMSFQPLCTAPRERFPWTEKARYEKPHVRMDTETVHHLSYAPPGHYVDDCCPCPCPGGQDCSPRAECC